MQSEIKTYHRVASELWHQYLDVGPGTLPADALDDLLATQACVLSATNHRTVARSEILDLVSELETLLRRCVERPEGLCFVTGEAGLIPRRDLHEQCEQLLLKLATWSQ